ncbi:MAG: prepilin-type N-terminal cleavage/methylation domain-containing protein [Candidatus Staskawiczbacteria bacterium]|nr:prepilin-type N-terminal cleavage/methylation domain-containing protein [Candidatus Staskawiczbacteria bacterium]
MKRHEGFTIIELIVVIAIIAVLAAVVLVNVTKYINKGKNASIEGNLASLVTRGTKYFEDANLGNGGYNNFCSDSSGGGPVSNALFAGNLGGTWTCRVSADNTKWCACSIIYDTGDGNNSFCVDSSGNKKLSSLGCAFRCILATAVCN